MAFFEALQPAFREYNQRIIDNAAALADAMAQRGYRIVSGGTDNHLFLIDLRPKGLTGNKASKLLDAAAITVSKSMIPFDPEKPWVTSGIRLGTPALTTRGFTSEEMDTVAEHIDAALSGGDAATIREQVVALAARHPMPG